MIKPTYEELVNLLYRVDHQLAQTDAIHFTDPITHEIEETLEAAGYHYDQRVQVKLDIEREKLLAELLIAIPSLNERNGSR